MRCLAVVASVLALLLVGAVAVAAKKPKDQIWTDPAYASFHVDRIAFVPVATFDHNFTNEALVGSMVGQAFRGTAYRWISDETTRDLLRAATGGDSLLRVLKDVVLASAALDSARVTHVTQLLHCDALLVLRVDQWEHREQDWNLGSEGATSITLTGALIAPNGHVLWKATGNESKKESEPGNDALRHTMEDSRLSGRDPAGDVGLERRAVAGSPGSFRETAAAMLSRWAAAFPPHATPAVNAASNADGVPPTTASSDSAAAH